MSFITDAQLTTDLAARLKRVGVDITNSTYWPTIITEANQWAFNEIIRRLAMRGYTADQVNTWIEGPRFQTRLGLWYAISDGGVADAFKDEQLQKFDERSHLWNDEGKELVCLVDADGKLINPNEQVVITTGSTETGDNCNVGYGPWFDGGPHDGDGCCE